MKKIDIKQSFNKYKIQNEYQYFWVTTYAKMVAGHNTRKFKCQHWCSSTRGFKPHYGGLQAAQHL